MLLANGGGRWRILFDVLGEDVFLIKIIKIKINYFNKIKKKFR
jgi:uncharacterized protein YhfF